MRNGYTDKLAELLNLLFTQFGKSVKDFIDEMDSSRQLVQRDDTSFHFISVNGSIAHCYYVDGQWYVKL